MQPFAFDNLGQHFLRVVEQLSRRLAHLVVAENGGIGPGQFPGLEEGGPVDVLRQLAQIVIGVFARAQKTGRLGHLREIRQGAIGARVGDGQPFAAAFLIGMAMGDLFIFGADVCGIGRTAVLAEQAGCHAHGAGRIGDIDGLAPAIAGIDLHRGMHPAGGRPADQQRNVETLAFHLGRHMHHLVQRGRDQSRQADDIGLMLLGGVQNLLGRRHHPQIDHFVTIALKHHADDVLADVMHIALHRRHDDAPRRFLHLAFVRIHEGQQIGHRLLHHPRRFHHLRQEHLARAEQVAHHIHARHQRAFDHVQRAGGGGTGFLGIVHDKGVDAMHHGMGDALDHRQRAPCGIFHLGHRTVAAIFLRQGQQPLSGVGAAVEQHVLNALAQGRRDILIDRQLTGIDDAHVHARLDGME